MKRLWMVVVCLFWLQIPSQLMAQAPVIRLSVSLLKFDSTKVGETSKRTFVISNTGSEILSVTGIIVSGPDALQFTASPTITRVVAGQSRTITVTFAPTQAGPKSATLSIAHNATGSPATVSLSGSGIAVRVSIITTFAGAGKVGFYYGGFSGDGGPASQAILDGPTDVVLDAKGNVYIADAGNNRIRRVGLDGIITTFAGSGVEGFSGDGGQAIQAKLDYPAGVAIDTKGNVYISDFGNHRIRQVWPDGVITTIAADLNGPGGVVVDARGNVYIADTSDDRIRRVDLDGIITTFAGNGTAGFAGDGGPAIQARLNKPEGIAIDTKGNVYIADYGNNRIRRVDQNGIITTVQADLNRPNDIAIDAKGGVYIAEYYGDLVRYVGPDGIITIIAGGGGYGFSGDGGPAIDAKLSHPSGVAVDEKGNIYIADTSNNRIRRVAVVGLIVKPPSPDFDGNGEVDFSDFFLFASAFGKKATGANAKFDLDSDGEIGFGDFFLFAEKFGQKV